MRRSEWEERCEKHQGHMLSKGVCPYCLGERLSHISAYSSSTTSSSPYYSDSNLSSMASPPHIEINDSIKLAQFIEKVTTLNKSRSLAVAFREEQEEDKGKQEAEEEDKKNKKTKKKKKKAMHLFKLITGSEKKRKKENALHSKTMKEKASVKWVLF